MKTKIENTQVTDSSRLDMLAHPAQSALSAPERQVIVLRIEFYHELVAHPVPNDLAVVKILAAPPATLDL